MEYRVNRKTGDRISVIGLGASYIASASEKDAVEALLLAHQRRGRSFSILRQGV